MGFAYNGVALPPAKAHASAEVFWLPFTWEWPTMSLLHVYRVAHDFLRPLGNQKIFVRTHHMKDILL